MKLLKAIRSFMRSMAIFRTPFLVSEYHRPAEKVKVHSLTPIDFIVRGSFSARSCLQLRAGLSLTICPVDCSALVSGLAQAAIREISFKFSRAGCEYSRRGSTDE